MAGVPARPAARPFEYRCKGEAACDDAGSAGSRHFSRAREVQRLLGRMDVPRRDSGRERIGDEGNEQRCEGEICSRKRALGLAEASGELHTICEFHRRRAPSQVAQTQNQSHSRYAPGWLHEHQVGRNGTGIWMVHWRHAAYFDVTQDLKFDATHHPRGGRIGSLTRHPSRPGRGSGIEHRSEFRTPAVTVPEGPHWFPGCGDGAVEAPAARLPAQPPSGGEREPNALGASVHPGLHRPQNYLTSHRTQTQRLVAISWWLAPPPPLKIIMRWCVPGLRRACHALTMF